MVERAIEYFSYAGLLVILLLASLGLPVPEEVPIITAGILSHQGVMRWWLALPTCIAGVLAGDLILYGAGRHWGERVLEHRLLGRLLTRARLQQIEASYRGRGVLIVFLSRNVMGLRAAAFMGAGIVGVPWRRFLAADGAAIALGVPLNFGIAYFFTRHLKAIFEEIHRVDRWIALAALAVAACWIWTAFRRRAERELARAAPASPRPQRSRPGPRGAPTLRAPGPPRRWRGS